MHAYQTFAIRLADDLDRDQVRRVLAAAAVESGPATYAFHRLPPHRRLAESAAEDTLKHADALHDRSLALPLYIGMRSGELDAVTRALGKAVG